MSSLHLAARRHRLPGVALVGATALVSGVSVFVNSYGVRAGATPAVYTTAKNLVAVAMLSLVTLIGWRARARRTGSAVVNFVSVAPESRTVPVTGRRMTRLGLAYVGVIGGGLAFVLFFDGLALSEPSSAAFWRDTLVLWVALLAVLFLRERLRWWNLLAIGLVVCGEVIVSGGVGQLAANRGEVDVLLSSLLWAVEIVIARRLLRTHAPATLAVVRMGLGALTLIVYLTVSGSLGQLGAMNADQWHWAIWTGLLLSAYVATWMSALARARAVDVTSVLASAALLTWLLQLVAATTSVSADSSGLVLVAGGAALVLVGARRHASSDRNVPA